MLSFFRRLLKSRIGILVTLAALGVIALAFAAGDITGLRMGNSVLKDTGDAVVVVGKQKITETDVTERAKLMLQDARSRNPNADMAGFIAAGQLERAVNDLIDEAALDAFAERNGMVISKRAVDGEIASLPYFQGPDGKFSQAAYQRQLNESRITDEQLRGRVRRMIIQRWMLSSIVGGGAQHVPAGVALPYASLLLERRQGNVAFVPTAAMNPGAQPDDKALQQFYKDHIAAFTVPARRVVRYAPISVTQLQAQSAPTDAEIAQAFQQQAKRFAATEKRKLSQVIVADQATADKIAKSTQPLADAAKAIGLSATPFDGIEKADFAKRTNQSLADAVFAAKQGATIGPIRSAVGYTIVRVEGVTAVPAKTLEQAKPELVTELTQQKALATLTSIQNSLNEGLDQEETFDQLVRRGNGKLQARETPPLLPNGVNPDDPKAQPDPLLATVLKAAFLAEPNDQPQVVPYGQDGFALVSLVRVVPATPKPFAEVRDLVLRDYMIDKGHKAAHDMAQAIVNNVQRGTPLAQALSAAGAKLPASKSFDLTRQQMEEARAQLAQNRQPLPPQITMAFSMAAGKAKLVEAPNREGFYIVVLDKIEPGDATGRQDLIDAQRAQLGQLVGGEYAQQFLLALRKEVEIKRNQAAIDRIRATLAGQSSAN